MPRLTRSAAKAATLENTEGSPTENTTFASQIQLSDFSYQDSQAPMPAGSSQRPDRISTPDQIHPDSAISSSRKRQRQPSDAAPPNPSTSSRGRQTSRQSPAKRPKSNGTPTPRNLPLLPDAMGPHLIVMFVGLNPGIQTSLSGHAYAHPSNLFWKLLHSSGLTPVPCRPEEDQTMPARYSLGLTNIVARPTRSGADLSKQEMDDGVVLLHRKAARTRAEAVCIVGKSIWESIFRVKHGRAMRKNEFSYGWQAESERMGTSLGRVGGGARDGEEDVIPFGEEDLPEEERSSYAGARVFVATSTSGLAATLSMSEKKRIWRELGSWAEERRRHRTDSSTGNNPGHNPSSE